MNRTLIEPKTDEVKINVRTILDAYHNTGLTPIQGEYLVRRDGKWCGCLLVALYLTNIGATALDLSEDENEQIEIINKSVDAANYQYGCDNTLALILGFDNYQTGTYFSFTESEYYTIGRRASQQLGL